MMVWIKEFVVRIETRALISVIHRSFNSPRLGLCLEFKEVEDESKAPDLAVEYVQVREGKHWVCFQISS